jgi:hypothetical protein
MPKQTILICDDRAATRTKWQAALVGIPEVAADFNVEMLSGDDLEHTLSVLEDRRRRARWDSDLEDGELIDQARVVVIDYDLREKLPGSTGERISYLARCYSRCGFILGLNQFERFPTFDLTLRGHPESFADLNLHDSMLAYRGLWATTGWEEFRPWAWPLVPRLADSLEQRVADVTADAATGILKKLGLAAEEAPLLSRQVASFLGGTARAERVSFDQFVRESGHGLRGADRAGPLARARIAASRVSKWLERLVLPGQDVLVDAPHIAARFPSLLRTSDTAKAWSETAVIPRRPSTRISVNLDAQAITAHVYPYTHWVSRPVWYWAGLSSEPKIDEVADPWVTPTERYVFCEDSSRFNDPNNARPFQPAGPTTFIKRYVERKRPSSRPPGLRYLPLDQFADVD